MPNMRSLWAGEGLDRESGIFFMIEPSRAKILPGP
jgi:hypothetical protein